MVCATVNQGAHMGIYIQPKQINGMAAYMTNHLTIRDVNH